MYGIFCFNPTFFILKIQSITWLYLLIYFHLNVTWYVFYLTIVVKCFFQSLLDRSVVLNFIQLRNDYKTQKLSNFLKGMSAWYWKVFRDSDFILKNCDSHVGILNYGWLNCNLISNVLNVWTYWYVVTYRKLLLILNCQYQPGENIILKNNKILQLILYFIIPDNLFWKTMLVIFMVATVKKQSIIIR